MSPIGWAAMHENSGALEALAGRTRLIIFIAGLAGIVLLALPTRRLR
jgi:hypothetical protein